MTADPGNGKLSRGIHGYSRHDLIKCREIVDLKLTACSRATAVESLGVNIGCSVAC